MTTAPPPSSSPLATGWTPVGPEAFSGAVPSALAWVREADGLLVAGSGVAGRFSLWTSTDGEAWAEIPDAATVFPADSWGVMAKGDPGFVIVGSVCTDEDGCQTLVWSSPDGISWSQGEHAALPTCASPCELGVEEVVAAPFGFVARGLLSRPPITEKPLQEGFLLFSEDGVEWSVSQSVTGDSFRSLLPVGDSVIAFGWRNVWSTTDGLTWETTPHAPDGPLARPDQPPDGYTARHNFCDVLLFGDRIVAVGSTDLGHGNRRPAAWYSEDGVAWQEATMIGSEVDEDACPGLAAAAVFDGSLVALSHPDPDGRVTLWTSPDGAVWTEQPEPRPELGPFSGAPNLIATSDGLLAFGYAGSPGQARLWIWRPPQT